MRQPKKGVEGMDELSHANSANSSIDIFFPSPMKGPSIVSRGAFREKSLLPPPPIWGNGFLTPHLNRPSIPSQPGSAWPNQVDRTAPALPTTAGAASKQPPAQDGRPGASSLPEIPFLNPPREAPAAPHQTLSPRQGSRVVSGRFVLASGSPPQSTGAESGVLPPLANGAIRQSQHNASLPLPPFAPQQVSVVEHQMRLGSGGQGAAQNMSPGGSPVSSVSQSSLSAPLQNLPSQPFLPASLPTAARQWEDGQQVVWRPGSERRRVPAKGTKKPVAVKKLSRLGPSSKVLAMGLEAERKRRIACKGLSTQFMDTCSNLAQEGDPTVFRLLDEIASVTQRSRQAPHQVVPAISHLVDDMNNLRVGKTFKRRAASDFGWAVEGMVPNRTWTGIYEVPSAKATCQVFIEGKEATTFQRVAMRKDNLFSFNQIGKLSRHEFGELYSEYMAATKALLPSGDGSELEKEKFEEAHDKITRYLKESAILRMAHVLSNPMSMQMFAEQKAASVPPEVLQRIANAGEFTDEQIEKIWGCWYETVAVMVRLKPLEVQTQAQVQLAVKQCLECPHRLENYGTLLCTAAELKRILEAQAKMIFRMNAWSIMAMLEPIQVARMHVASGHHPLRLHLLFLSGIFPKPRRAAISPPP